MSRDSAFIVSGGLLDSIGNHALVIRYLQRRWTVGGISSSSYVDINYIGSVEKVGVAPEPKRVGPASMNLEYG